MNHRGTQNIETPRLLLRPFRREDAAAMYRNWASDAAVTTFLTWQPHESEEATAQLLADWCAKYAEPDYYQWAMELREMGEVIGSISVVHQDERTAAAEIGYCIGRPWWGQALTPEALWAVMGYLLETVGFECIRARHDIRNAASGAVMRKCGMRFTGVVRREAVCNQGVSDLAHYSLLREEYRQRRDHPEADDWRELLPELWERAAGREG